MKKPTALFLISLVLVMTAAVVTAQDLEGKLTSGIDQLLGLATTVFWSLLGLLVVTAGIVYAVKRDDPEARKELMGKLKGWIIGALLVSLALTIAAWLKGIWA